VITAEMTVEIISAVEADATLSVVVNLGHAYVPQTGVYVVVAS
jgi:hypothetical protein